MSPSGMRPLINPSTLARGRGVFDAEDLCPTQGDFDGDLAGIKTPCHWFTAAPDVSTRDPHRAKTLLGQACCNSILAEEAERGPPAGLIREGREPT